MENVTIIIPARKGSKGFPDKNRYLFDYTLQGIPISHRERVIFSTNDKFLHDKVKEIYPKIKVHTRSEDSATDTASSKKCLQEVINDFDITGTVIMLYLTYPERKWTDITSAYSFYKTNKGKSLLCKTEITDHPYLCMYENDGHRGKSVIGHNLCRRQDYPPCFKLCHYVSIFEVDELENISSNLYNEDTLFYKINLPLDIDNKEDLKGFDYAMH